MMIDLPRWFYEGVVEGTVLAIPPAYFEITSGTAQWLYRVMRRHAGRQTGGWAFSFKTLHAKSGSSQRLSDFARDLRRIAAANDPPEYLSVPNTHPRAECGFSGRTGVNFAPVGPEYSCGLPKIIMV